METEYVMWGDDPKPEPKPDDPRGDDGDYEDLGPEPSPGEDDNKK
ncbi:hypothetical protein [Dictyobacter formicarum]|uniref:Uncharacterized protein n=1 Tax=Dictyobacter formicarum TaxID=2778368 RepID=A0ABQ3VR67_9CHLR|nr:hypothetical protein [Dictyobacter formicarum]GHO88206.1 hypothetical protein KSZ_62120 [Dictyobacter formicarum]